ncbi:helix-turn-helix domain-containing protein [Persicobacter diffluens]|uniref:Transposase IS30-like HTH domain-containing protein n=1 Tax=Persicobacter diffluens TaxID=981 RepID=A0AAN4W1L7_9BACT|nr:hypothetical protein PEDI_37660 [Persicobacter diffluens]
MYLTYAERCRIDLYHSLGMSNAKIARLLDRHVSTIGRELKRNKLFGEYDARLAQRRYECRKIFVGLKSHLWCGYFRPTPYKIKPFIRRITQWFSDYFDDFLRLRTINYGLMNFNLRWRHQVRLLKTKGPWWYGAMARWILRIWDLEPEALARQQVEAEEERQRNESIAKMLDELDQSVKALAEKIEALSSKPKIPEAIALRAA